MATKVKFSPFDLVLYEGMYGIVVGEKYFSKEKNNKVQAYFEALDGTQWDMPFVSASKVQLIKVPNENETEIHEKLLKKVEERFVRQEIEKKNKPLEKVRKKLMEKAEAEIREFYQERREGYTRIIEEGEDENEFIQEK